MTPSVEHARMPRAPIVRGFGRGTAWTAAGTAAVLLAPVVSARAQVMNPSDAADTLAGPSVRTVACVQRLSDSAFRRSAVFLRAEVLDSADGRARPAADVIAQEVGIRVRAALAPSPEAAEAAYAGGSLPAIDSAFGRVYPEGRVLLTARRGAGVTWRVVARRGADPAPIELVERALRAGQAAGDVMIPDELMRGDSLAFDLAFVFARLPRPGEARDTIRARNAAPVFTALMPEEKQAAVRPGTVDLRYPAELQAGGFEGRVELAFVVDTAGRAEPGTLRDAHPATAAALAPGLRGAYGEFVHVARDAVLKARFYPATVAGCPVRQLVRLPLQWKLDR